jgi:hypothetical protein
MNRNREANEGQEQRPRPPTPDEKEQPGNPVEKNEQLDEDGSPGGANG